MEPELEVTEVETTGTTVETKSFTQEEVDKLLQIESDKRVTKALQTAKQKWETEYTEKLEAEKAEAERLAQMTQEERFQSEIAKEKKVFESERAEFLREKMEMTTIKELSKEKLPTDFVPFVVADTEEQVSKNIEVFKKVWVDAINEAVSAKLIGRVPQEQNTQSVVSIMSKEDFAKLPYKRREKLLAEDPDILSKLK